MIQIRLVVEDVFGTDLRGVADLLRIQEGREAAELGGVVSDRVLGGSFALQGEDVGVDLLPDRCAAGIICRFSFLIRNIPPFPLYRFPLPRPGAQVQLTLSRFSV